ncbi:MAG: hypothetical protein IKK57_01870 [Clostridia bacterium]|nr:hypothetical protein [Clostridia bacterium]
MSNLMDRVSRLKGMVSAMNLNLNEDASRLMLEMLGLMGEMAQEMQQMQDAHAELNEYVESLDDDLADLAESLLDGGEEDMDDVDTAFADADEEDEDNDDEFIEGEMITYACPSCGKEIEFDPSDVDFDEDYLCPDCGKPIFPEVDE